jgi:hypothetical protein
VSATQESGESMAVERLDLTSRARDDLGTSSLRLKAQKIASLPSRRINEST